MQITVLKCKESLHMWTIIKKSVWLTNDRESNGKCLFFVQPDLPCSIGAVVILVSPLCLNNNNTAKKWKKEKQHVFCDSLPVVYANNKLLRRQPVAGLVIDPDTFLYSPLLLRHHSYFHSIIFLFSFVLFLNNHISLFILVSSRGGFPMKQLWSKPWKWV